MIRLERLMLTDFRSYPTLDLAVGAAMIALAGENGAGKTNLLEAISFLTPGRGLRRVELADAIRTGAAGGWAISATLLGPGGEVRLGTGLERDPVSQALQRKSRIDREPVSSVNAFSEHLRVVWLTPEQDGLFRGPAGDRRRFLDRLVLAVDAEHGSRVNALEKGLRSRNRLLEDAFPDARWLEAVEREIAEVAIAVAAARREAVERLASLIADERDETSPFPWAHLQLDGELEQKLGEASALDVEDFYRDALQGNRDRDRAAGRTLRGPQASDLVVRHGPKDVAADQASTGEQKALLIGLVLAHARLVATMTGMAPIVLLDEVAAHLDPRRRQALYENLAGIGSQVWMTGADAGLFADLPAGGALFEVTPGRVSPIVR